MTPQELERMPDQGLEFEQSVGPKESPKVPAHLPALAPDQTLTRQAGEEQKALMSADTPLVLSQRGDELTTITVLTSVGEKVMSVSWFDVK